MVVHNRIKEDVQQELALAQQDVYDHECALHAARQSRVDAWVAVAADKLHVALVRLTVLERQARDAATSRVPAVV